MANIDLHRLRRQKALNWLQSVGVFMGLIALAGMAGLLFAGTQGLVTGLILLVVYLALTSLPGDVFLRAAFRAQAIGHHAAPELCRAVAALAVRASLPRPPALYFIPSDKLLAVTAGSTAQPAIGVSRGCLRRLAPRELVAVLAHEMAHIRHGDLFVMRLAGVMATLTRTMAQAGILLLIFYWPVAWMAGIVFSLWAVLLLLVAPILSDLLQLFLSRQRELMADTGAAEISGDPLALAQALRRIHDIQGDDWERSIQRGGRWLRWFRTHPGIEERINNLEALLPAPRRVGTDQDWTHLAEASAFPRGGHSMRGMLRRWLL